MGRAPCLFLRGTKPVADRDDCHAKDSIVTSQTLKTYVGNQSTCIYNSPTTSPYSGTSSASMAQVSILKMKHLQHNH